MIKGGRTVYGFILGVIMLETKFPRIKGDIGNAETWDFPVIHKRAKGVGVKEILSRSSETFDRLLRAAIELEEQGVSAITTSCGLTILFQEELARKLHTPIFTSSVLMLPLLRQIFGEQKKICILTASAKILTTETLKQAGIHDPMVLIREIEGDEFKSVFLFNKELMNPEKVAQEVVETAMKAKDEESVELYVLECTNLAPFAGLIQRAVDAPVFDIRDLVRFVRLGFTKSSDIPLELLLKRW